MEIKTKPAKDKIEGIPPQFSSFEIYRVKRRGGGAVKTVVMIGGNWQVDNGGEDDVSSYH